MQYRKWKRRNGDAWDMDEDVIEWMSLSLTVTGRALSSASRQQSVHVIVASISIVARVRVGQGELLHAYSRVQRCCDRGDLSTPTGVTGHRD